MSKASVDYANTLGNFVMFMFQSINISSLYPDKTEVINEDAFEIFSTYLLGSVLNTSVCDVFLTNTSSIAYKNELRERFHGDGGGISVLEMQETLETLVLTGTS